MARKDWLEAAKVVARDGLDATITCPINGDGVLEVAWLPFTGREGGEIHLRCPNCVEEVYILAREAPIADG